MTTFFAGRIPIIISENPWIMGLGILMFVGLLILRYSEVNERAAAIGISAVVLLAIIGTVWTIVALWDDPPPSSGQVDPNEDLVEPPGMPEPQDTVELTAPELYYTFKTGHKHEIRRLRANYCAVSGNVQAVESLDDLTVRVLLAVPGRAPLECLFAAQNGAEARGIAANASASIVGVVQPLDDGGVRLKNCRVRVLEELSIAEFLALFKRRDQARIDALSGQRCVIKGRVARHPLEKLGYVYLYDAGSRTAIACHFERARRDEAARLTAGAVARIEGVVSRNADLRECRVTNESALSAAQVVKALASYGAFLREYQGTRRTVSGEINAIQYMGAGAMRVSLQAGDRATLDCWFSSAHRAEAEGLVVGRTVRLEGKISGNQNRGVWVTECRVR